jgi:hypothetical protein
MDQVTQQNAALVEEAAAAAGSLQDQSAQLAQVVGGFKLDGCSRRAVQLRGCRRRVLILLPPSCGGTQVDPSGDSSARDKTSWRIAKMPFS